MSSDHAIVVCLIPARLEKALLEPLRRHYADRPHVKVIVDRRERDRRAAAEPDPLPFPPRGSERRSGTDRRRPVLPRQLDDFPPRLRRHRASVRFVQRLVPVSGGLEGLALEDVLTRVRAGDAEAPTELYWRCFERVHSRLAQLLGGRADGAVAAAFGRVLDAVVAGEDDLDEALEAAAQAAAAETLPAVEVEEVPETTPAPLLPGGTLLVNDPLLDEPITVSARDPRWFGRAQSEREAILRAAGLDVVAIEHVGGTAVPAVAARPVVDLLVGVDALPVPHGLRAVLAERGYEDCGDAGTPGRAYFRKRGVGRYDVHVVEFEGPLWHGPITLREHLAGNPVAAQRLAAAKRRAAEQRPWSALEYAALRAPAIAEAVAAADESADAGAGAIAFQATTRG